MCSIYGCLASENPNKLSHKAITVNVKVSITMILINYIVYYLHYTNFLSFTAAKVVDLGLRFNTCPLSFGSERGSKKKVN